MAVCLVFFWNNRAKGGIKILLQFAMLAAERERERDQGHWTKRQRSKQGEKTFLCSTCSETATCSALCSLQSLATRLDCRVIPSKSLLGLLKNDSLWQVSKLTALISSQCVVICCRRQNLHKLLGFTFFITHVEVNCSFHWLLKSNLHAKPQGEEKRLDLYASSHVNMLTCSEMHVRFFSFVKKKSYLVGNSIRSLTFAHTFTEVLYIQYCSFSFS